MRRLAVLLVLAHATGAAAYPFLALRPGGTPFEGPTDPELSAIWWNPAALGKIRGFHLGGVGQLVFDHGSVERDPICEATGMPSGSCGGVTRGFPAASFHTLSGTALGGLSWDVRSENFTLALAAYAPWESHRRFATGGAAGLTDAPGAYHLRDEDFSTTYLALGAALRPLQWLYLGVNVALAWSSASIAFDRDAALSPHGCPRGAVDAGGNCTQPTWAGGSATVGTTGYENAMYAERIRVRGGGGGIPSGFSLGLGGMVQATERVAIGLSWTHIFPIFSGERYNSFSAVGGEVTPAAAAGAPCKAAGGVCRGGGGIEYDLPDTYHLGATWRVRDDLELSTWGRVVLYGSDMRLDKFYRRTQEDRGLVVRLSGDPVEQAGAPERILLGRALVPAFAGEVGVRWRPRPPVRLGFSFIGETSAVPGASVSAEAIDGPKLDGMAGVEWQAARWLRLTLGYEVTAVIISGQNPAPGVYDPGATVRCVDARYALPSCGPVLDGHGLPSASGRYALYTHRFNLGVMLDF